MGCVYQQFRRWLTRVLRGAGVRSPVSCTRVGRAQGPAERDPHRQLHASVHTGKLCACDYDGAKRRNGSKVHMAVDTSRHLLALTVTPADQGDREQVAALAEQVQELTGGTVKLAYVDQGYT